MKRPSRPPSLPRLPGTTWLAFAAVVLVVLIVFARALGSVAFLWVTLAGTPFLLGYARLGTRGFLLIGAVLVGSGIGILFEANLAWEGAYLTSVGAALATAEALEPTRGRLALLIGAILAGLGVVLGVAAAGTPTVSAFVVVALVGCAVYLRGARSGPRRPAPVR